MTIRAILFMVRPPLDRLDRFIEIASSKIVGFVFKQGRADSGRTS